MIFLKIENTFSPKQYLFVILPACFYPLTFASTFDSVQSAQRAKASLNGADIYSGCCTLKIEYAKVVFLSTARQSKPTQQIMQLLNLAIAFYLTLLHYHHGLFIHVSYVFSAHSSECVQE